MIQVAIVGYGLSGQTLQATFFEYHPHFNIRRIVTKNQNPGTRYPKCIHTQSFEEAVRDPEIDLISITTPDETHFPYSKMALAAGKHVLVEKPFTSTREEAETLFSLAKETNKKIFVFQNRRFDSDFQTVSAILESGVLGQIIRYEAHYNRLSTQLSPKKWKEEITPSSGILFGLGPHILDQALSIFGTPNQFWGKTYIQRNGSKVDDAFDLHLDYHRTQVFLSSNMFVREETPRYIIHGENGSFIKYGIDPQEDHLKAGILPGMTQFGVEEKRYRGILNVDNGSYKFRGEVETKPGNWNLVFDHIAASILEDKNYFVSEATLLDQIKILSAIKNKQM
jgi:predicted dehydrogenase